MADSEGPGDPDEERSGAHTQRDATRSRGLQRVERRGARLRAAQGSGRRLHIVEELLHAQDLGWQLIEAVGQAEDKATAHAILMAAPFEFDAIAAEHVLDMQLSARTRLAVQNRQEEHHQLIEFLGQQ